MIRLFILLMIIGCINGQLGYQQRAIYLSRDDNVCVFGELSDKLQVVVNIDGETTIEHISTGNTICNPFAMRIEDKIHPGVYWSCIT